jgi:hypothetical protein
VLLRRAHQYYEDSEFFGDEDADAKQADEANDAEETGDAEDPEKPFDAGETEDAHIPDLDDAEPA